jgi:hypothetical protein
MMFSKLRDRIKRLEQELEWVKRRIVTLERQPSPWEFLPRETVYVRKDGAISRKEIYRLTRKYDKDNGMHAFTYQTYVPGDIYMDDMFYHAADVDILSDADTAEFKRLMPGEEEQ